MKKNTSSRVSYDSKPVFGAKRMGYGLHRMLDNVKRCEPMILPLPSLVLESCL